MRALVACVWLTFALTPAVLAQPYRVVNKETSKPSTLEARWAKAMRAQSGASTDDRKAASPRRLQLSLGQGGEHDFPDREIPARGVEIELPDLSVQRLRFRTAEEATDYVRAGQQLQPNADDPPHLLEQRGKQVLLMKGSRLEDPKQAAKARNAAWSVLPNKGAGDEPDAIIVTNGDDAYTKQKPGHGAADAIDSTFAVGERKRNEEPKETFQMSWKNDDEFETAVPAADLLTWLKRSDDYREAIIAQDPDDPRKALDSMRRYFDAFEKASQPKKPARRKLPGGSFGGLSGALDRIGK